MPFSTSVWRVQRNGRPPRSSILGTVIWSLGLAPGTWVRVPALPLTSSVTLGKSQSLKTSVFFPPGKIKNIYKCKLKIFIRDVYLTRLEHGSSATLADMLHL